MEEDKDDKKECLSSSRSIVLNGPEQGLALVPDCYILPLPHRANPNLEYTGVPVIDFARLHHPSPARSLLVRDVGNAFRQFGYFQVSNHGISSAVMEDALRCASEFFGLPSEEKMKFMSGDVTEPVRYGASVNHEVDKVQFWRVFLKHYAHPLAYWAQFWPNNPPDYKEKMGTYATKVRKVGLELMGVIMESLELEPTYLGEKLEDGLQLMTVNCYPPCPQPELALGLPPHSDYSYITILLQDCQGFQVMDNSAKEWRVVPELPGCLQVHVGDFLEVLSNGRYKSVLHRAVVSSEKRRLSIGSFVSLDMDQKVETAEEMVDGHNPKVYRDSCFRDFLNFLSSNDVTDQKRTFLDTLRIKN